MPRYRHKVALESLIESQSPYMTGYRDGRAHAQTTDNWRGTESPMSEYQMGFIDGYYDGLRKAA